MAFALRQGTILTQRPTQVTKLILTPKLQQAISLLQLSTLELADKINQEMEENPVLEEMVTGEAEVDGGSEYARDESNEGYSDIPEATSDQHARQEMDWDTYAFWS